MKMLIILFLLVSPAYSQLTEENLQTLKEELRIIVKEEITASEKRVEQYIDLKIGATNAQINAVEKSLNARIDTTNAQIGATNSRIDAVEKNLNILTNATDTQINALNMRIQDVAGNFNYVWIVVSALVGV